MMLLRFSAERANSAPRVRPCAGAGGVRPVPRGIERRPERFGLRAAQRGVSLRSTKGVRCGSADRLVQVEGFLSM